jgi:radical SAM-linked protein
MAYSSGFNPHPRISYAGASPTGAASEAEYLEIGLARESDPAEVGSAIDQALPDGLDVMDVVVSAGGSLADRLEASCWRITLPGASSGSVGAAIERFLGQGEVMVERMTKKGLRRFDARAAVVSLELRPISESGSECAIIEVVLRHGTPSVRPDDVLAGLCEVDGLQVGAAPLHERLAQGPLDAQVGTVGDPLAPDRDAG